MENMKPYYNDIVKNKKIIESVVYLLKLANGLLDKYHLIKFLFLADKVHLIEYGRTITQDRYLAMEYGPVGSLVKDILECKSTFPCVNKNLFTSLISVNIDGYSLKSALPDYPFRTLSESEKKVLSKIYDKFHDWNFERLLVLTHELPEWKRHSKLLKTRESVPIKTSELIDSPIFETSKERIQLCKEVFRD